MLRYAHRPASYHALCVCKHFGGFGDLLARQTAFLQNILPGDCFLNFSINSSKPSVFSLINSLTREGYLDAAQRLVALWAEGARLGERCRAAAEENVSLEKVGGGALSSCL